MKTKLALFLLSTFCFRLSVFAQGSLTPPGAPAPTMKSLDQVEARAAITNAGAVTISQPGSYYLTRNITVSSGDAITIATHGVTLDLNGFTVASTAASTTGTGILLNSGLRDISIFNGHIRGGVTNNGSGVYSGSGFGYGINYSGGVLANVLVSRVSVSGCLYHGIYLSTGNSTVAESCTVRTMGNYGISASAIKGSVAVDCGDTAINGDQVSDCRGESEGSGTGVYADTAQNCHGFSVSGTGLYAITAQNCYGYCPDGYGVYATTAQNCYGYSSSGTGLYATRTAMGCHGGSSTGTGLYASRTALGCHGSSSGTRALYSQNAAFCTGYRFGGRAIEAIVANGCYAAAGTNFITHKYNMP